MSEPVRTARIGDVLLCYDEVTDAMLAQYVVWREYYVPDELELMRAYGATAEWLEEHLIDRLEDGDIWYTLVGHLDAPVTTFMAVSANFSIGGRAFPGYLTLVDGEIRSGRLDLDELLLSASDLLADDNAEVLETLAQIVGRPRAELLPVTYEVDAAVMGGALSRGVLEVALPSVSEG